MVFRHLLAMAATTMLFACAATGPGSGELELTDTPLHGKFVWNDLITDNTRAARAFYGGLFGWTFESAQRPGGGDYELIVSRSGHYVGGMVERPDPGNGVDYSRWLNYLAVPDVDAAVGSTTRSGGAAVVAAQDLGAVARVAVVTDPQGAAVGFADSRKGYPVDRPEAAHGEVAWHELLAADAAEAASFYAGLAGYDIEQEARPGGTYRWLSAAGRQRAGVMQRPDERVQPLWLTHFRVDDLSRAVAQVERLGGQVLLAPSAGVRQGRIALVTDPTGAVLALSGPANSGGTSE